MNSIQTGVDGGILFVGATHSQTAFAGVTVLLLTFLILVAQRFWSDPLRHIPGPFLARWTPLWLVYQARMGRRYIAVDQLHHRYGAIVRIAPQHVSVADKSAIEVVYAHGKDALKKSRFYDAFVFDKTSLFSETDPHNHLRKKRLVSPAFSTSSLQDFVRIIEGNTSELVMKLDHLSHLNADIDMLLWFHYFAFDTLSDLAFGQKIGMLNQALFRDLMGYFGSDVVELQTQTGATVRENAVQLIAQRDHLAVVLALHPYLPFLSKFIPDPFLSRGRQSSTGLVDFARREVIKRLESNTHRQDILERLIAAYGGEDIGAEGVRELISEAVTLLIAGSDTTSNSLAYILHLVLTHPHVHSKLITTLEAAVQHNDVPTYDSVKNMPYLDAVIDEGLRYHATIAFGLPRVAKDGGINCYGIHIPEGTEVSIPAYTVQHDPSIWGDPEVFRPDRWEEDPDLKKYLMVFGKGPRACIGRNLAYMEMRLVLATIILRYDFHLGTEVLETVEGLVHKPMELSLKVGLRKSSELAEKFA
ncbi:benzoate para-hydroxylase [Phlebopus sp. FC_14]|nr:benzoate para-hydroxylase [Phlebopus sp. FC_14]